MEEIQGSMIKMLSDQGIRAAIDYGDIYIEPYYDHNIQPNSLDLFIEDDVRHPNGRPYAFGLLIGPGDFVLGTSAEYIELSENMAAMLHTRSSIGRLGISMHATAGLIDAGFKGRITYEITNFSNRVVELNIDIPVAQLTFHPLDSPALKPYDGIYNGQIDPTISKYYE